MILIKYFLTDMNEKNIIQQPISELPLSKEFKAMAAAGAYNTLQDMLHLPVSILLLEEGFTYHYYEELRNFLNQHKLLGLLKE
jgi:hypothetical protein